MPGRRRSLLQRLVDDFRIDVVWIAYVTADYDIRRTAWLLGVSVRHVHRMLARAGRVKRSMSGISK